MNHAAAPGILRMTPRLQPIPRLLGLLLALGGVLAAGEARMDLVATFPELLARVGWEATASEACVFVQATDLHLTKNGPIAFPGKYIGPNFITDINQLRPAPRFLAITGDLTGDVTRFPASWKKAEVEFLQVKEVLTGLDAPIAHHIIIGNNDCSWETFGKVWPDRPLDWSFDQGGIHLVGVSPYYLWTPENTNHAGPKLDPKQMAWLRADLAGHEARSLVIFTHEPLSDPTAHLLRAQIESLLPEWTGEVWNIAGHMHMNRCEQRRLARTTMRIVQTTTPVGGWRLDTGAYRLFFAAQGRITGTALRWLTATGEPRGFTIEPPIASWPLYVPAFEAVGQRAAWSLLVGQDDQAYRHTLVDTIDALSYLRAGRAAQVAYRLPVAAAADPRPSQLLLLAEGAIAVEFSADGLAYAGRRPAERPKKGGELDRLVTLSADEQANSRFVRISPTPAADGTNGQRFKLFGLAGLR